MESVLKFWIGGLIVLFSTNLVDAQSSYSKYIFVKYCFNDGWCTQTMIKEIEDHYSEDDRFELKNDTSVFVTQEIRPIRADSDSLKFSFLKMLEVINQIYSMQDFSDINQLKASYFISCTQKLKKKYQWENLSLSGCLADMQNIRLRDNIKIHKSETSIDIDIGCLSFSITEDYYDQKKYLYFDALTGEKKYDPGRLRVYRY